MIQVEAAQIPNYIHPQRQEIVVVAESGKMAFIANATQIIALANAEGVLGAVEPRKQRLQFVKLTIGVQQARRIAGIAKGSLPAFRPTAEDNKTVTRSGMTYSHHMPRSLAYNRAAA